MALPRLDGLWLTVALDQYFLNGGISNGTADKLHKAGYSVKSLGLKPGRKSGGSAAGKVGKVVANLPGNR